MKIFKELKKEVENNSKVITAELSENLLIIYTNVPFKDSSELMVLYVVKSVKGNYLLTDLGHLLEMLFSKGEGVDKVESNIGITKLDFDQENVYTVISKENVNTKIDEFIKFVKVLGV